MTAVRNVLFVMCDQLRRDFVSCYGASPVPTPNLDRLVALGVRFDHAYVQSGVCGPARMSYYTGRYVSSHGATWNRVPLSAAEHTLGDYLNAAGRKATLAGKTHVLPDTQALARFGIEVESERGALLREGGFTAVDRYDGHTPPGPESGYAAWLRARGYGGADPWSEHVIAVDAGSRVASGWQMRNVHLPSRVAEPHSETAYMTDLALDWIRAQGETPWVLHLSYVKPHWPYVAPAPFHAMFRKADVGPILHGPQDGTADEHPVVRAYREHDECLSFAQQAIARHVRPAYMGLIAQLDVHLGRVLDALAAMGRVRDTLIVFASDHGEFSGDRGLGEKELFYDEIVRVPFIVCDPDPRADATRGTADARFVEGIDVVPTILDALGMAGAPHRIEGRSLLPLTRGDAHGEWRDAVFSELDYGFRRARRVLGRGVRECRAFMVRTEDWKYVHWEGFRPQLFDLDADPREFADLGADPRHDAVRARLRERLFDWIATVKRRTTVTDEAVAEGTDVHRAHGIHIGIW
ncbi:MAG: sulfatase-like hydrolase/transferase [Casimicrobiaceae bacterium]